MVGEHEGDMLSAEEARYLMELMTCAQVCEGSDSWSIGFIFFGEHKGYCAQVC
jgi:hypothetical protein